jgi:hypothetical protein
MDILSEGNKMKRILFLILLFPCLLFAQSFEGEMIVLGDFKYNNEKLIDTFKRIVKVFDSYDGLTTVTIVDSIPIFQAKEDSDDFFIFEENQLYHVRIKKNGKIKTKKAPLVNYFEFDFENHSCEEKQGFHYQNFKESTKIDSILEDKIKKIKDKKKVKNNIKEKIRKKVGG